MENNNKQLKAQFGQIMDKKIKSFEQLFGGFSNNAYLVNDAYVMKTHKEYIQPFVSFENEAKILDALKDNKSVETCLYANDEENIKVSKFIHGARPDKIGYSNDHIILVAKFLKKLHKVKVENIDDFDPLVRLQVYKLESGLKIDGRYERKIVNRIEKILEKEPLCLCHNDVVNGNLLFSFDKLSVIDWEFAGLNSLYFDLSSFISENNLSNEQARLFLKTYFGASLNQSKIKKVLAFNEFLDLIWYYWAGMMLKYTNESIFEKIAKEKLERIKFNMTQANKNELVKELLT